MTEDRQLPKDLRPGDILVFDSNTETPVQAVVDRGGPDVQIILASGPPDRRNNSLFPITISKNGNGGLRYPANITTVKR
ncbi:MAG: hypothetical protein WC675_03965 [Patescibacteria group bacterium]|jgi:hypothetical protein